MQAEMRGAHDSVIWTLAWHPAGHLLATGSGDTCTKFWGRARPGDPWRDREQREQEENAATEGVQCISTFSLSPALQDWSCPGEVHDTRDR